MIYPEKGSRYLYLCLYLIPHAAYVLKKVVEIEFIQYKERIDLPNFESLNPCNVDK